MITYSWTNRCVCRKNTIKQCRIYRCGRCLYVSFVMFKRGETCLSLSRLWPLLDLAKLPNASFPASPLLPPLSPSSPPTPSPSETELCLSAVAEVWRFATPTHASASAPKLFHWIPMGVNERREWGFFSFFSDKLSCYGCLKKELQFSEKPISAALLSSVYQWIHFSGQKLNFGHI